MRLLDWLIILLSFLIVGLFVSFWASMYRKGQEYGLEVSLNEFYTISGLYLKANVPPYHLEMNEIGYRTIFAYNATIEQTDSEPCISASGLNVCETKKNIIATNEFAFGTLLMIDGEIWEVQDRMNKRYQNGEIDLLMDDYQEAKDFGKRTLMIELAI